MKVLSILDVLKKEYLGKEVTVYLYQRKTWDNGDILEAWFSQPKHLDNYKEVKVVVNDVICEEICDFDTYYIYKIKFEYKGEMYEEELLTQ